MTYIYLAMAILFEVAWALGVKHAVVAGRVQFVPAVFTLVTYLLSLVFLTMVAQRMNIGTAYAVWAGSGAAIIALIGIAYYHEPSSLWRILSLVAVVVGVIGLNLTEPAKHAQPRPGLEGGAGAAVRSGSHSTD
ncbi:MAG: multidrug efflux SMR transporter [Phycisphaerales bacterium]